MPTKPEATVHLIHPHLNQQRVLTDSRRFNVIKCGRRFGKTELAVYVAATSVLHGNLVGYFAPTYKDAYETWGLLKWILGDTIASKDEQVKQIKCISKGILDVWSLDNPDSGRGRKYHKIIIDECEKILHLREAWEQNLRATLTDYQGRAWFLSTPKFGKTYFKELFRQAGKLPDWTAFKFTSYDNPHINPAEIDSARDLLDPMTFRCEYMADDVDLSLNPFAYAFSKEKHICEVEFLDDEPIQLSFDFNVDPITCLAAQSPEVGHLNIIREFRLSDSNIYELCDRIKAAYPDGLFLVTGDATGRARTAITTGNLNYYRVIREQLQLVDHQMQQPTANPSVKDTRVLLNSLFQNGQVRISPACEYLIEDLIYCETDDEGDLDKSKDKHKTHLMDCLRYVCSTFHREFIRYGEFVS